MYHNIIPRQTCLWIHFAIGLWSVVLSSSSSSSSAFASLPRPQRASSGIRIQSRFVSRTAATGGLPLASSAELENEEPLSVMFQRAVVLQRAGSHDDALDEYTLFLKAARQCQVDPSMYAEVYGNMGALYLRKQQFDSAKEHLQQALEYRPSFGTAHVNLAVVALQQASSMPSPTSEEANHAMELIGSAKKHCNDAIQCNTDPRSVTMAQQLLHDIDKMLSSSPPLG
jgi:tetratricopeptide (TPR) repeat protein